MKYILNGDDPVEMACAADVYERRGHTRREPMGRDGVVLWIIHRTAAGTIVVNEVNREQAELAPLASGESPWAGGLVL